ncbi:MAG: L-2-amino-thiazoline-4-carboxylic acid hydrolase [Candidatus Alcyoniella australis]|nr:L-2-amino-thiazoline-4-carboxylic acid hydrolase [Candidatus Alcyoniella australis]
MGERLDLALFDLRSGWAALKILASELGWFGALGVGLRIAVGQARGEPFKKLGPPQSRGEELTRRQAAGAVLLERALARRMESDQAFNLTQRVVEEGSLIFLRAQIPRIERPRVLAMSGDERLAFLRGISARFPNSTVEGLKIEGESEFEFKVVRCLFVELCARIERPDLAPLFCAGDLLYFEREQPQVRLQRPSTLSEGGECCHFQFRWKG